MKSFIFTGMTGLMLVLAGCDSDSVEIPVQEFGAIPDDGQDDVASINQAIRAAAEQAPATVVFEPGTYNLKEEPGTLDTLIDLSKISGVTLLGQVDADGNPATRIERNVTVLGNDQDVAKQIAIVGSTNITLKNLVLDNMPPFATSGKITAVDPVVDTVDVEIFEGQPHFDGMRCYSANSWNLETGELINVPALTIGTSKKKFSNVWKKTGEQSYRIQGLGFSDRVDPGQGISWHFYVVGKGWQVFIDQSSDVRLENVHINNTKGLGVLAKSSRDLAFVEVVTRPVKPALAVGARDAFHLVCNDGSLLIEDCTIKGYRWDPMNIKSKFCEVLEVAGPRTLNCEVRTGSELPPIAGSAVVFWVGDRPFTAMVSSESWSAETVRKKSYLGNLPYRTFTLEFAEDLPETVLPGVRFTPQAWTFDSAEIKNTVIEGNYGRGILYQGENLHVDGCTFRNNSYADIALGPVEILEGGFVRHAVIENCLFERSSWILKSNTEMPGNISLFQACDRDFSTEPYNEDITIRNNVFKDCFMSAISIANAQNVTLSGNRFVGCANNVLIDDQSSLEIRQEP